MSEPLLAIRDLTKIFHVRRRDSFFKMQPLHAVNDVSFDIRAGEVVGVVGESGCGKSTLGRLILRLVEPTEGELIFDGRDLRGLTSEEMRRMRSDMQMVFQDPNGSLNPAMAVGRSISETLRFHGVGDEAERHAKTLAILRVVGLEESHYNRLPHEMSGGQNQRVGIARALIVNPRLVIMDEAVSALDVSVQAQILKLLEDIRAEFDISILFISHDLSVVRRISDRLVVLYLGRVMEIAPSAALFAGPRHPYTRGLLASRPSIDPDDRRQRGGGLEGDLPSPLDLPRGCPFVTRCERASDICWNIMPEARQLAPDWVVACHHAE